MAKENYPLIIRAIMRDGPVKLSLKLLGKHGEGRPLKEIQDEWEEYKRNRVPEVLNYPDPFEAIHLWTGND